MKVTAIITAVLLFGIFSTLAIQTFDHPPERWRYTVISPKDNDLISTLDKYGAEGWEVISARRATGSEKEVSYEMILKCRSVAPTQSSSIPKLLPY
jgi:hypothetical protein